MLSVFGAWVGAVVAFYFGAQSLRKAQDTIVTLSKAISAENGLSKITVEQLLNENPAARNVATVTLRTNLGEIWKNFEVKDLMNVVVIDDQRKPLGLVHKNDFDILDDTTLFPANSFTRKTECDESLTS